MLFVGVDGGSTKTEAVILRDDGAVLGRGIAGPSNLYAVDTTVTRESVTRAIIRAVWQSGIERATFEAAFFGMAGAGTASDRSTLRRLLSDCVDASRLDVQHDAYVALAGATNCGEGVIVQAGTGSCAFGLNARGEEALVGGWGHAFGDQGSAYDIARRALVRIGRYWDKREHPTVLIDRFAERFGLDDPRDMVREIYKLRSDRIASLAALAPIVTQAAEHGDAVAVEIIEETVTELADLVAIVAQRLGLEADWNLIVSGGVFRAGDVILRPFERRLAERVGGFTIARPRHDGAVGAALLAAKSAGVTIADAVCEVQLLD